jgi:hypothetical protein
VKSAIVQVGLSYKQSAVSSAVIRDPSMAQVAVLREQHLALTAPYPWAACSFTIKPVSKPMQGPVQALDMIAEVRVSAPRWICVCRRHCCIALVSGGR